MMATETGSLRRIARAAVSFDRSAIELGFSLRCTIGVAIPLIAALLTGHAAYGIAAAIGAMNAGFASKQGVYRTRAAAMLLTSIGMAVSLFVGSFAAHSTPAITLVTALWGFAYGIIASLGSSATTVGLNSVVALVIFSGFDFSVAQAILQAGLLLAGALLQTLLLVLIWPLRRFTEERRALAGAFRMLATYASGVPNAASTSPESGVMATVRDTLSDPQPFARRGEVAAFQALLDEAERIRTSLAALARDRQLVREERLESIAATVDALLRGASVVLSEIAAALDDARGPDGLAEAWRTIDEATAALESARSSESGQAVARAAIRQAEADALALGGQLRTTLRIAHVLSAASKMPSLRPGVPGRAALPRIADGIETLRANLTPGSIYFGHGLRLAVVLAIATLLAHVLPLQRSYWAPMTAVLVLRPDFATTFVRGISRLIGTVAGAVLATLIAAMLRPGPEMLVALAIIFAWFTYMVASANYAALTVGITGYVVFLLALSGLPEQAAVLDRVAATSLGGLLALAAYSIAPTWESRRVPAQLARLLDAQRQYLGLVLDAYIDPRQRNMATIREAQTAAWSARSSAEASVDRMLSEPSSKHEIEAGVALGLLAASRRFGLAALSLHAHLGQSAPVPRPALRELADAFDASMRLLAERLRQRTGAFKLPPLREMQVALVERDRQASGEDVEVLAAETDLLVDSINTMAELLER